MGKASDMGRAWISGLKLKQWLRWIGGDSPLPEVRSRKIMGATAGVGVILIALASFTVGVGKPNTGVKPNTPAVPYSPPVAPPTASQNGFVLAPSTTVAASTTTIGAAPGSSKKGHSHIWHTGAKRARTRGLG